MMRGLNLSERSIFTYFAYFWPEEDDIEEETNTKVLRSEFLNHLPFGGFIG